MHLRQAELGRGVAIVRVVSVGVDPCEKLVDAHARGEGVDADHGGSRLVRPSDVPVLAKLLVELRGLARHRLCVRALRVDGAPGEQARAAGLEVMASRTDLVDSSIAIGLQRYANVDVG